MLSLISGQDFMKAGNATQRGPEWHGPCPVCGGRDRFHIWPEQGQGGTFWCRGCGKHGDLIEFYRWRDNLSYRDACARAGVDARTYTPQDAPASRQTQKTGAGYTPARSTPVLQLWAEHAAKMANWCHEQLFANADQLAWLEKRGVTMAMITKYGLGWNPTDAFRTREAWGLETVRKADGKPKKLWLPQGLVIPLWIGGQVARLRIRRPNVAKGELKYYVVPGSGREPLLSETGRTAYVIVESELDALVVDGAAGDLVGVVAMGNASAKPTEACHAVLSQAVHLSICLDSDAPRVNPTTGRTESAGAQGSIWWLNQYRHAERVPVIGGKDPGDAYAAGVDLRAWVLAGLPPRFHIKATAPTVKESLTVAPATADGCRVGEAPRRPPVEDLQPAQPTESTTQHRILTLQDGQEIHVVSDQSLWEQLTAEGLVVFSENELLRLQAALVGLEPDARAQAVQAAIDAKLVFPGAYVRRGEVMA
ncbi:MAG: hypothetical protein EOL86_09180 [Deltaproteobacteria bacterium]|nr:hypothetical protein [Deltaproteobacteria bacterium]